MLEASHLLAYAAPAAPLLPPLTIMLGCIVAIGLVVLGRTIVTALFEVAGTAFGWVPWLGGRVQRSLIRIEQRWNSYLSGVIDSLEREMAKAWHGLASAASELARTTYNVAAAVARVAWYVETKYSLPALAARLGWTAAKTLNEARKGSVTRTQVVRITREITHPNVGRIGAAIKTVTRSVAVELDAWRTWTFPRVKALERSVGHAIPRDIAGLRARADGLGRRLDRLWDRVRRNERALVGAGAVAVVATAVAKLGGSWIRCGNWRRAGRQVCRMDPVLLDMLMLETLAVVGSISIVEFTRALQSVTGEVSDAVRGFVREA